jgi:hypothetical protein
MPSHLVYFARTASLIEGLGTRYDAHFNALEFATPIALSLRARIFASLYPDGEQPRLDPARVIGAALGAVARVVQRAGAELVVAVRDAVASATLAGPPTDGPAAGVPQVTDRGAASSTGR